MCIIVDYLFNKKLIISTRKQIKSNRLSLAKLSYQMKQKCSIAMAVAEKRAKII
jgi:hypothetical protein